MSGRRKPNSGDRGPSGVARLLSLVSRPLKVSILATRRAISITLRGYLRAKSGGGANQGFRARIAEFTGGATQRIIVALRGDLRKNVTLRETVARGNRRWIDRVPNRADPPRHRGLPVQAEGLGAGGRRLGSGSKTR